MKHSAGWLQLKQISPNRKVTGSIPAVLFDLVKNVLWETFNLTAGSDIYSEGIILAEY